MGSHTILLRLLRQRTWDTINLLLVMTKLQVAVAYAVSGAATAIASTMDDASQIASVVVSPVRDRP